MSTRNVNPDLSREVLRRKLSEALAVGLGGLKLPFNLQEAELRLEQTINKNRENINVLGDNDLDSFSDGPLKPVRRGARSEEMVEEAKHRSTELTRMIKHILKNDVSGVHSMFKNGFQLDTEAWMAMTAGSTSENLSDRDGWIYFILSNDQFHKEAYPRLLPMVKLFIEKGAAVDTHTKEFGDTPLHSAARHDIDGALTTCLLNNGANVNSISYANEGKTALQVAKSIGNRIVATLIEAHMKTELYNEGLKKEMEELTGEMTRLS